MPTLLSEEESALDYEFGLSQELVLSPPQSLTCMIWDAPCKPLGRNNSITLCWPKTHHVSHSRRDDRKSVAGGH